MSGRAPKLVSGQVRLGQARAPAAADGPMRPKDPYSTPARRRRIIADVAVFLLRQYCVKACENVVRFRKWTAASLVIQRAWRCYASRRRLRLLRLAKRTRASQTLQCMVRCALARQRLRRLRLAEWTRRALHLAKALQRFWRGRLRWRRKKREMALYRARMLKKKSLAAINIQRCYRGLLCRRLAKHRASMSSDLYRRRLWAAVLIQACVRRRRACKFVNQQRKRRRALWKVGWCATFWFRRLVQRKSTAAIKIQRIVRGFLGRRKARRARHEKLRREREEEERRRLEELRLAALAAAEEAATRRIELRISVNAAILRRIGILGPAEAVLWCLKHKILCFLVGIEANPDTGGYGLGPVPLQVVGTVESVFPSLIKRRNQNSSSIKRQVAIDGTGADSADNAEPLPPINANIVDVDAASKCIKLRKWADPEQTQASLAACIPGIPSGPLQLPIEWKQVVRVGDGAEVAVSRENWSVEVRVKIASDAFTLAGHGTASSDEPNSIRWTVVTIVLEAEREKDKDSLNGDDLWSTAAAGGAGAMALDEPDAPEFKFKFKDTVVLLQPPARLQAAPFLSSATPPTQIIDEVDSAESNMLSPKESPVPQWCSPIDDSISDSGGGLSPSQHRITILIEPNWDAFARTIQRCARPWAQSRIKACRRLQTVLRRRKCLRRWRWAVLSVLTRAHRAATRIQTMARSRLSHSRVNRLRLQVCARLKASARRIATRVVDDLSDYKFASDD